MSHKPKSLVIGGAGLIGFNLALFLQRKSEVVILDNFSTSLKRKLPFETIEKDIRKFRLEDIKEDFDCVYYFPGVCASPDLVKFPVDTFEVNVIGLKNVLDFTSKRGIKIVYASSSEVYGNGYSFETSPLSVTLNERSGYDIGKIAGETLLLSYARQLGQEYCIVRPFNVYGPFQYRIGVVSNFIVNAIQNKPLTVYGSGKQIRTLTYVKDASEMIALASDYSGVFNIAGEEAVTINELAEKIIKIAGSESKIIKTPLPYSEVTLRVGDNEKIKSLGFNNFTPLEKGLEETIRWYRENEIFSLIGYRG